MKNSVIKGFAIIFMSIMIFGCEATRNANNKQKGAVIGATSGAVIGGVIGNNVGEGNTALGAIIGGVVGGATGAYIGNRMDKQAQEIENEIPGAEVTRVGEGINVTFDENSGVNFDTEKYNLSTTSQTTLDKLAGILLEYPKTLILVEGHTDSTGNDSYNYTLSQNRAQAVTNYLVSKGVPASSITTKWYGETQPKFDNSTVDGRSKNRRVEFAIIASEELIEEAEQNTN
ncbi:MAG TPA: OmpA family protein [Salinimicrobium sp.]|nr:OmpA family protein [Salinimicrobium sp.]